MKRFLLLILAACLTVVRAKVPLALGNTSSRQLLELRERSGDDVSVHEKPRWNCGRALVAHEYGAWESLVVASGATHESHHRTIHKSK